MFKAPSVQISLWNHVNVFSHQNNCPTDTASKMEFFTVIRTHFGMCGIRSSKKSPKSLSFNLKNSTVFILACLSAALTAASLCEANGFDESTNIVFRSLSMFACNIVYGILVWNSSKIFKFIESVDNTVEASKYWNAYRCEICPHVILLVVRA